MGGDHVGVSRRKRSIGVIASLGAILLVVASCSGNAGTGSGSTAASSVDSSADAGGNQQQITLHGEIWSDWNWVYDAAEAYHAEHPNVTIDITAIPGQDYYVKLPDLFKSGQLDFSAVAVNESQFAPWVKQGILEPLDDIWDSLGFDTSFPESMRDAFTFDSKKYAVAAGSTAEPTLFYNKELFDKLGIPHLKSVGATEDEFYAVIEALKKAGYARPMPTGVTDPTIAFRYFTPWVNNTCGVGWISGLESGESKWSDACSLKMFKGVEDLVKNGAITKQALTSNTTTNMALFEAQKVPMVLDGSWSLGTIDKMPFEVGWAMLPSLVEGKVNPITFEPIDGISINKASPNIEEAKNFLKYLANNPNMWQHGFPLDPSIAPTDSATAIAKEMFEATEKSREVGVSPYQAVPSLDELTVVDEQIKAIISGDVSPEQAVATIQKKVDENQ